MMPGWAWLLAGLGLFSGLMGLIFWEFSIWLRHDGRRR